MWVFTSAGFVSAVEHRNDKSSVMVRARDFASLKPICKFMGWNEQKTITSDFPSDYPYRLTMTKDQFSAWLADEVANYLTYANFKNEATRVRGHKYHDALMKVWSAMHALTPDRVINKNRKAREKQWPAVYGKYGGTWASGLHSLSDDPLTASERSELADGDALWEDLHEHAGAASEGTVSFHDLTEDEWRKYELTGALPIREFDLPQ